MTADGDDGRTSEVTPAASTQESADTPLVEVIGELERDGFEGQFRSVEGAAIECLACRSTFEAGEVGAAGATRLEGESDPSDMLLVVAVECPTCATNGTLVLSYGPDATAEDADVVLALDRPVSSADGAPEPRRP